jgi:hypothetical protein
MTNRPALIAALVLTTAGTTPATATGTPGAAPAASRTSWIDVAHARAVDSFRRARFAEAYGRFIEGAEAGNPASARYAIWMCENGTELFGAEWDCASHELEEWRALANRPARTSKGMVQRVSEPRTVRTP